MYDGGPVACAGDQSMHDLWIRFKNCFGQNRDPRRPSFWSKNENNLEINQSPVSPENLSKLINLISDGTISGKIAKTIFEIMSKEDKDPNIIVEEKGLKQESDPKALEDLIQNVLSSNEDKVKEYKSGKDKLFGFFVGQVMKESKGKGNPQMINKILKEKLNG